MKISKFFERTKNGEISNESTNVMNPEIYSMQ